ncbi:MAG TPA: serine--tRNA ligase [Candidatus Saccharimonadales bacterium]|nr:serine--tRNA ligase [Candidatus Saccharimonadales bacterium]
MLDIQFIRDNAALVQTKAEQKGYKNVRVAELLELDTERRTRLTQIEELRARRNTLTAEMKGQKPTPEQAEQGRQLKEEIAARETELKAIEEKYTAQMMTIPNVTFDDVPIGGEEDSVEIKVVGDKPAGAIDHLDYAVQRDWVDFERGAKVAGTKFYYLKGDLALLENAITQYALQLVLSKGFTYLTVPHMVNSRIATGAGFAPRGDKEGNEYFVEDEDLTLIGTAEAPLTGFHADEILDEADLPKLYVGYSPCYRREAGTYGKHTRGLFRVHQFNKLEMYAFTLPEASREMHERILAIEEEIWQAIGVPYHIITIASGDLGAPAAKKYDIEYWSKVDGAYRELTSCSNCTDFQARNLNIRVRRKDGRIEVLHTLNGTAVSLARSLVVVLEHFQNEDGTLTVPEVLRPYMGGRDKI